MIKMSNAIRRDSFVRDRIAQGAGFPSQVCPLITNRAENGPRAEVRRVINRTGTAPDLLEMIKMSNAIRRDPFVRDRIAQDAGFPSHAGPLIAKRAVN